MKKDNLWLLIFAIFLILFAFFSNKIGFHDSYEYINIAKNFAGIKNIDLFSGHSLFYPLIISLFLKVWPSFAMLRLVNALWIFLIGLIFLKWLKNKTAFLIFAFSPLTWYVAIQTTPVLPASFFFFLSFLFFHNKTKYSILYSGLFLGISCTFYTPMILIGAIFILAFFWSKPFSNLIVYFAAISIGFLPRIIQDYYLFKNPLYSLIRYAGANFVISLGLNELTSTMNILSNLWILSIIFLIAPFFFKIYKVEFSKYKPFSLFLLLTTLLLLLRVQQLKYFLIISPIFILLLSRNISQIEIKWNSIISIILIIILIYPFFGVSKNNLIEDDLKQIINEYDKEFIVAGLFDAPALAAAQWENTPRFIWHQDYIAESTNQSVIRHYSIPTNSRIPLRSKLEITANFKRSNSRIYKNNFILVLRKDQTLEGFVKSKCYKELCVHEKI